MSIINVCARVCVHVYACVCACEVVDVCNAWCVFRCVRVFTCVSLSHGNRYHLNTKQRLIHSPNMDGQIWMAMYYVHCRGLCRGGSMVHNGINLSITPLSCKLCSGSVLF